MYNKDLEILCLVGLSTSEAQALSLYNTEIHTTAQKSCFFCF